jgi:teichuronic acid biosynthesis glycosyltransferase TuaG
MEKNPKVSIIIALYNSAQYVEKAVGSVFEQSYPYWELLLVDDASTDETLEIAEELAKKDKRITVLRHATNQGSPAFGRNTGLAAATGEFVTFLDHDDAFKPLKLEKMVKQMMAENLDFLCSNIDLVNAKTGKIEGKALGSISGNSTKGFARRLLKGNFVPPNSTLIRRSVFELVGNFDTKLKGVDDFDMWYRIARIFPAGVLEDSLASWTYKNASSISADDEKMITDERVFYDKILTTERAFPGNDPRGVWKKWEKETAQEGVNRATIQLANRLLLKKLYKDAATEYAKGGAGKYAKAAKVAGPFFRTAYKAKRALGARSAFKPIDLNF